MTGRLFASQRYYILTHTVYTSRMAKTEPDSKEGILGSDQLNLKVLGQDGQVVQFKIKRNTPLRKLMSAYCDRSKLAQNTIRFMFDGTRIDEGETPKSMDMEDGDTIEVFTQQSGGGAGGVRHHVWHCNQVSCEKGIGCRILECRTL